MSREETKLKAIESICGKLSERKAVLFLGAGINAGIKNDAGEDFPLGSGLSDCLCRDLLEDEALALTLDEAAEIARYKFGCEEVNKYFYSLFNSYDPGVAHLSLVQLPWDVIYSTNYDLLIERAAKNSSSKSAGNICVVSSNKQDITPFREEDILYYKLHGSIDIANTDDGKLTLTKEDYKQYDLVRKRLFKRLENDLLNKTFVFIGYALKDPNFRNILEDCREMLGTKTLPRSFAIRDKFSTTEEIFWSDKYNIQLIEADSSVFLQELKDTWVAEEHAVIPLEERKLKEYIQVDSTTSLPKVGESFYSLATGDCRGKSDPKAFFKGAEPTWADIREEVAPVRDMFWTVLEPLFEDLSNPNVPPSAYLVTGPAGTGKTTLIYTLGYLIARDFDTSVLIHIPGTPFDVNVLGPLVDEENSNRIIIIVRHAAEYLSKLERFIDELKEKSLPVTIILEDRKNQWDTARAKRKRTFSPPEFEMGVLSQREIEKILESLDKHKLLGKLTGTTKEYQIEHFKALADKELLVALRELTRDGDFDKIIKNEYDKIPTEIAKKAYLYVAALGQIDLALRYETLLHLIDISHEKLKEKIFTPTERVLLSGELVGSSRHNMGYTLRARHPIIASVIFSLAAPNDDVKYDILSEILLKLDPGYHEDNKLMYNITRRRELVNTLESHEKRRAIYELLTTLLPDNPYVFQHRSLLEKEMGKIPEAIKYARQAVSLDNKNQALRNTLGMVLEFSARKCEESIKKEALLREATDIFDENIKKAKEDPFGYLGKVFIIKQRIKDEADEGAKALMQAESLSFLEEAYEVTDESGVIAGELALAKKELGSSDTAIDLLTKVLEKKPNEDRLCDVLVRLQAGIDPKKALEIAIKGAKYKPTAWRLQRHIARLQDKLEAPIDSVKGHYEAAIRHHRGDVGLMVEYGAYLFMHGQVPEANKVFSETRNLKLTSYERTRKWKVWKNSEGERKLFSGKVSRISGVSAFALAIPENFEAHFYRTVKELSKLKNNDEIKFTVSFNAHGPGAYIVT